MARLKADLERLIAEDRLTEIPGVGDAIADIVTKLHRTGTHPSLEKLRKGVPPASRRLFRVPGLRPEKVLRACAKHDVAVEINAHPWEARPGLGAGTRRRSPSVGS
ncbi:hypothetical protein [Bradyrhizobium genosp. SA-3]|uniref:hypothetical protein n=1 Tax=Bradyrhizobium genosp. SA-3 TaxID=508868 RepID=UPI0026A87EE0